MIQRNFKQQSITVPRSDNFAKAEMTLKKLPKRQLTVLRVTQRNDAGPR